MKIITDTTELKPAFDLSRIAPVEDILFFDIETTGLRKESTQVYLIGCAFFHDGSWKIRQYLAESALDEREVMESFADFASSYKVLIHFNGDGFDIPYLAYKAEFYDLDLDFSTFQSIDIYKLAKPLKKLLGLESMSQKSIERFLQINRDDLYGGGAARCHRYRGLPGFGDSGYLQGSGTCGDRGQEAPREVPLGVRVGEAHPRQRYFL